MLITVTGRRTGRRYTIPVGYQRNGDVLTILVSEAPKKRWWRNFHDPAPVEVRVKGKPLSGTAELVAPASPEFGARAEETARGFPAEEGPTMQVCPGVRQRNGCVGRHDDAAPASCKRCANDSARRCG